MFVAVGEQPCLLRSINQSPRKRSRLDLALFIEFSEVCYRLLNDAPANAHTAH